MSLLKKLDKKLDKIGRSLESGLDEACSTVDDDLKKGVKDVKVW